MAADAEPVWPQPARALRVRAGHVLGTNPRLLGQPSVCKEQTDGDARAGRASTSLADQTKFKGHSHHLPRRWTHWDSVSSRARTPATEVSNDDSPGLPSDAALGHERSNKGYFDNPVAVSARAHLTCRPIPSATTWSLDVGHRGTWGLIRYAENGTHDLFSADVRNVRSW